MSIFDVLQDALDAVEDLREGGRRLREGGKSLREDVEDVVEDVMRNPMMEWILKGADPRKTASDNVRRATKSRQRVDTARRKRYQHRKATRSEKETVGASTGQEQEQFVVDLKKQPDGSWA